MHHLFWWMLKTIWPSNKVKPDIMSIHRMSSLGDLCASSQACTVMHVLPSTQTDLVASSRININSCAPHIISCSCLTIHTFNLQSDTIQLIRPARPSTRCVRWSSQQRQHVMTNALLCNEHMRWFEQICCMTYVEGNTVSLHKLSPYSRTYSLPQSYQIHFEQMSWPSSRSHKGHVQSASL